MMMMTATTFGRDVYEIITINAGDCDELIAAARDSEWEVRLTVPAAEFGSLCDQLRGQCDSSHDGSDLNIPAFEYFQGADWRIVVSRGE